MSSKPDYSYEAGQRQVITRHADVIVDVLPTGEFAAEDLSDEDWVDNAYRQLREAGALDQPTTRRVRGSRQLIYAVPEPTRQLAEHAIETRDAFLPCGHRGISNQGDHFECQFDGCDEQFSREEVTGDDE